MWEALAETHWLTVFLALGVALLARKQTLASPQIQLMQGAPQPLLSTTSICYKTMDLLLSHPEAAQSAHSAGLPTGPGTSTGGAG